jgi:hypothetical protein
VLERHLGFAQSHVPRKDRHVLDADAGFSVCGPFGEYAESENKTFMTLAL